MALSVESWITIIFYAVVILLLIAYRKKFEFQNKIIALRRLKFGIAFMQNLANKHAETFKLLGYIGIGVGFVGMFFMIYVLGDAFLNLFFQPNAPAAVAPLIPGVNVPGSPIKIPLWVIIPLFFVVLIHESGHGLVAKAHKVPIVSTGIVFFGPIAGAFVEPDEKKLKKSSDVVKLSVFAAGPFFNALTALIVFVLMMLVLNPLTNAMTDTTGVTFAAVQEDFPAALAGVDIDQTYVAVNDVEFDNVEGFVAQLNDVKPGDELVLRSASDTEYSLVLVENPDDPTRGFMGVSGIATDFEVKAGIPKFVFYIFEGLSLFFFWIFLLSIGLGAFNLLPLGPVDGGQMSRLSLTRMYGEKKGILYWGRISMFLFLMILILLFVPILRNVSLF